MKDMLRFAFLCTLLGSVSAGQALAQSPQPSGVLTPLDHYRAESFSLRFAFSTGMKLTRNGQDQQLGFFGRHAPTLFAGSDAALDAAATFRSLRIVGMVTNVAGAVLTITTLVLLILDTFADPGEDRFLVKADGGPKPLFYELLIPGALLGAAGGIMIQVANAHLSDAVEYYNADLYERLRAPSASARNRGLALRLTAKF